MAKYTYNKTKHLSEDPSYIRTYYLDETLIMLTSGKKCHSEHRLKVLVTILELYVKRGQRVLLYPRGGGSPPISTRLECVNMENGMLYFNLRERTTGHPHKVAISERHQYSFCFLSNPPIFSQPLPGPNSFASYQDIISQQGWDYRISLFLRSLVNHITPNPLTYEGIYLDDLSSIYNLEGRNITISYIPERDMSSILIDGSNCNFPISVLITYARGIPGFAVSFMDVTRNNIVCFKTVEAWDILAPILYEERRLPYLPINIVLNVLLETGGDPLGLCYFLPAVWDSYEK